MHEQDAGEPEWRRYERTAEEILRRTREHFHLSDVQGKQTLPGVSGTAWEIDAKGVVDGGEAFVLIEARRHTTEKLDQEALAAIAFRVRDTGAVGGIVVSPLGLQAGAKLVAEFANITPVRLSADATPQQFVMEFLGNILIQLGPGPSSATAVGHVIVAITNNTDD